VHGDEESACSVKSLEGMSERLVPLREVNEMRVELLPGTPDEA
jgi:hypothetical protein